MSSFASIIALGLAAALSAPANAQVTRRVSFGYDNAQGNGTSEFASISADGRFVAFESQASNLVPDDANGTWDVFVRDLWTETTERMSVAISGGDADSASFAPSISADGRFVAFESVAANLVRGDSNGVYDVFVRDRQLRTTERVSVGRSGEEGNGASMSAAISADGRFVAFASYAANLVESDTNGCGDVFVRDRASGMTERVSRASDGTPANGACFDPSISADGRRVAFVSIAANLDGVDTNAWDHVFVHDRTTGETMQASLTLAGGAPNQPSEAGSISANGRYVVFSSRGFNMDPTDTNGGPEVFVRDLDLRTTERASVGSDDYHVSGESVMFAAPAISDDGRFVVFQSEATGFVSGDTNGSWDVFVRDRRSGTTSRASVSTAGDQANSDSYAPMITRDGRWLAFESYASNLDYRDTNLARDVFMRDLDATGFSSLCDPGSAGVIGCPCANPPSDPGRGCDNSASTGGAVLSASGIGYLSMDSLVFTTSGEKATATSIVLQGTSLVVGGTTYGQGIRCVGGTLKRLFTKTASGGSITAPSPGAGDPSVSARSSAKGDPISAGQSRYYVVAYRDPIVLGGCPASSTFNCTQTGQISWSP